MNTKSDSDNIVKNIVILFLIIGFTLNINLQEVSAKTNNINKKYINNESSNLFNNIYNVITGKSKVYEVRLEENLIGYININGSLNKIKDLVLDNYLEDLNINKSLVLSFDIEGNLNLEKSKTSYDFLESEESIASKIYNISINYPEKIKLNIKYLEKRDIEINPSTVIIPTDEIFIGESKVVNGEFGLRKQVVEITSKNREVVSTRIVKDDIVKEYTSKKIYRGTKNPYEYGVAFLNKPTRGGYLTSGYGERWNSFHKGIDIGGAIGDDVLVALDGEVTYAEFNNGGYGNLIIVKHDNNMMTYYGHLDDFYVKVGDLVKKGDVIGALGNTGFSTGPHLHFELRVEGNPVDPYNYIVQ